MILQMAYGRIGHYADENTAARTRQTKVNEDIGETLAMFFAELGLYMILLPASMWNVSCELEDKLVFALWSSMNSHLFYVLIFANSYSLALTPAAPISIAFSIAYVLVFIILECEQDPNWK